MFSDAERFGIKSGETGLTRELTKRLVNLTNYENVLNRFDVGTIEIFENKLFWASF